MLRVAGVRDRTGRYYLADLSRSPEGALTPEGGWPQWIGPGAARLGLVGPVDPSQFTLALSGRHPTSGRPLVARQGRIAGYDLTFAAPKSVSVLAGLADPVTATAVVAAHREAVEAAMSYVADRAVAVRRGSGDDRVVEPADHVLAVGFTHRVSRALDPHLHSHVVVANVARVPDGRWTGLDSRGLFAHAAAAGQRYDAELRHRLGRRLGLGWCRQPTGTLEVAGIDPEVIAVFSGRRAEIGEHLAVYGRPAAGALYGRSDSSRARQVAWAATRDPKVVEEPTVLARGWSARAAAAGLDRAGLQAVVDGAATRPAPGGRTSRDLAPRTVGSTLDEYRFAKALTGSGQSSVTRRDAVAAWAHGLDGGAPSVDIDRCVDRLATWGTAVGVAEPRRRPAGLVPAAHLLGTLGPRPADPDRLVAWRSAAADIDRYRHRWGVADDVARGPGADRQARGPGADVVARALGADGTTDYLSRLPVRQLADHLAVARRVADARRLLGREASRNIEGPDLGLGR